MNVLNFHPLQRVRAAGKGVLLMGAGAALATGIAVMAQQAATTTSSTSSNCALATAAQTNLNNRITMIGMTQPDPSKYFTVGGVQSCIGAVTNLDLSNLIPDPMGLLTSMAKQLAQAAVSAACTAARNSLSDYISKYNVAAGMLNNGGNTVAQYIDTSIGKQVGVSLTSYGTNYAAPAGTQTVVNPLAGVTSALNTTAGSTASTFTSSVTSSATSAAQQVTTPVTSAIGSTATSVSNGLSSLGSKVFGGN